MNNDKEKYEIWDVHESNETVVFRSQPFVSQVQYEMKFLALSLKQHWVDFMILI